MCQNQDIQRYSPRVKIKIFTCIKIKRYSPWVKITNIKSKTFAIEPQY